MLKLASQQLKKFSDVLDRLVVNVDSDLDADTTDDPGANTLTPADVLHLVQEKIDETATLTSEGEVTLHDGDTTVSTVIWQCDTEPTDGVPTKNTLERLVCAAIARAYPERPPAIARWLNDRGDAPAAGPKEHAWSYMAGWYAQGGCEEFFRAVWRDDKVVPELEALLRASSAWTIANQIVRRG